MNLYVQLEEAGIIEILPIEGFILKKDFDTQVYKLIATTARKDLKNLELESFNTNRDIAIKKLNKIFEDIKTAGTAGRTALIWEFKK